MPSFSPKIGTSSLTPNEPVWKRFYRRYARHLFVAAGLVVVLLVAAGGWWLWQGQYVPAKGGSVIEGMVGQPSRLNPLFAQENLVDAQLTPLIFRGLLKYDRDQQLVGDLADSWERSDDGKTYQITLGNNKWHDGQPVTADDVRFTIELTQKPDYHGSWNESFTDVKVEVKDQQHLSIILNEPFAPFGQTLTMGILPKHILGGKTIDEIETDPFNVQPIGSGRLKFDSVVLDQQTKKFTQLRFAPANGYLDVVVFQFYDDIEAMITDFKLGKIQMLGGSYDQAFDSLKSFPDTQRRNPTLKSQSYGLFFNLHEQPMNDIGLRQSLAYAVPKQKIIDDVFDDQVVVLNGVYQQDFWAFSDRSERYEYNMDKAQKIWDKVEAKPKSIRLLVPDKPIYHELAATVGRSWQELGLNVTVKNRPLEEMGDTINKHEGYDVVLLGEQSDVDPDRYSTWHSTQMPPDGLNITGESNKRVDKALEDGRKELSQEERKHDYDLFQYYLAKDAPVIWLYQPKYIYIWSNKVKGVDVGKELQDPQDRWISVSEWYVKTRRRD